MTVLLLLIIYLIFISLGLPDSLVGSSWPALSENLSLDRASEGILMFTVSICTILSSFLAPKLIKILKRPGLIGLSIGLTVAGLICFSYSSNFIFLVLSCIPLGLGAGGIDATLNNFVALHYKAIHLNWLNAFWGIGAAVSPFIVSAFLTDFNNEGWRNAALCLGIIQSVIFLITISFSWLWKKVEVIFAQREKVEEEEIEGIDIGFFQTFKVRGIIWACLGFFAYIAIEQLVAQWFTSMLSFGMGLSEAQASSYNGLFYIGMVCGRFASGVISLKVSDKNLIRGGEVLIFIGCILFMMVFSVDIMPFAVILIGLGCSPIFPAILHATPTRFSREISQSVMSVEIGIAYVANISIAPLFGLIGENFTYLSLPFIVFICFIILALSNEMVLIRNKDKSLLLKNVKIKS